MTDAITDVYDIGQPTPISLKKRSAIAISLEIWRREINEYRTSHILESFDPRYSTPSKVVFPELPSVIYNIIYKYVRRFGVSMNSWTYDHYDKRTAFRYYGRRRMNILQDFDDFVCDYDGSVHYLRTAERMVRCDKFDHVRKFDIACMYFFEDDIRRLWPFVSNSMDIDSIDFDRDPYMYYWICRLTNNLNKITLTEGNVTIDEEMFNQYIRHNMPSLEYFWNSVSREKQMHTAAVVYTLDVKTFFRIIFRKLDYQKLSYLINERSCCSANELLRSSKWIDEDLVLGAWFYIRNVMNESKFKVLVADMVKNQYRNMKDDHKDLAENYDEYNADVDERRIEYTYLCCELWNTSPPNLKSSVTRDLLPSTALLIEDLMVAATGDFDSIHINVELLLLILRSASIEKRSSFWNTCWHLLIAAARGSDLQRIMVLCFETREHEMAEFKDLMARSDDVRRLCVQLLREGEYFNHLNELVSFICPEIHNARNFKQRIVRSFISRRPHYRLETWTVLHAGRLNDFITSAYDDVDLLADLKNQLMPSAASVIQNGLWSLIRDEQVSVQQLITFIGNFVSMEENVVQIKMTIINSMKRYVTATARRRRRRNQDVIAKPYFTSILLWCLGSDEEVDKFKLSCAS